MLHFFRKKKNQKTLKSYFDLFESKLDSFRFEMGSVEESIKKLRANENNWIATAAWKREGSCQNLDTKDKAVLHCQREIIENSIESRHHRAPEPRESSEGVDFCRKLFSLLEKLLEQEFDLPLEILKALECYTNPCHKVLFQRLHFTIGFFTFLTVEQIEFGLLRKNHVFRKKPQPTHLLIATATMQLLKCFPLNRHVIILYASFLCIITGKTCNNARSYLVTWLTKNWEW